MLRVTGAKLFCALTALITLISTAKIAEAGALHTPVLPAWGRPTTNAQAVATSSTYQEWDAPSPTGEVPGPAVRLPRQAFVNPNANNTTQAVWYDSSASTDDAFQVGTDVYSFDGIISPVVVVPGYNKSDSQLNVSVEVQTFGGTIDTNALTATYTDPSGNAQSFLVSTLPSFSYSQAYNDGGTPFGCLRNGVRDRQSLDVHASSRHREPDAKLRVGCHVVGPSGPLGRYFAIERLDRALATGRPE